MFKQQTRHEIVTTQVLALDALGGLGYEYMGNIHVTACDIEPVEDLIVDINSLSLAQFHLERCKATLVQPKERSDEQKLLLSNMADLKALGGEQEIA